MEETLIVLMFKNKETGILEKEIGCYRIFENENLIYNTYAMENDTGGINAHVKLTCGRDVEDWEFSAIYDYYDTDVILNECSDIIEMEDCFNPTWEVIFPLSDDTLYVEEKINRILSCHKQELDDVYNVIKEKKDEYNAM